MTSSNSSSADQYYIGPERRHARKPRRHNRERRHRLRTESMLTDCRSGIARRWEDEQGFYEIADLYSEPENH